MLYFYCSVRKPEPGHLSYINPHFRGWAKLRGELLGNAQTKGWFTQLREVGCEVDRATDWLMSATVPKFISARNTQSLL